MMMDFESFKKAYGRYGRNRRFPASEFSDRVINLNRLEDRNYENQCKIIEKERRTVLTALNRDIKKLEYELYDKQELMHALYRQEKLKLLNSFPYKLNVNEGGYINELEQLGLYDPAANDKKLLSSLKLPSKTRASPIIRVKKVHSANGRFGGDVNAVTLQRSASANENSSKVENNDHIKPILIATRPRSNVIDNLSQSKREILSKTNQESTNVNKNEERNISMVNLVSASSSTNDLSFPKHTSKLPVLLSTEPVQVRPKDLKLMKLQSQQAQPQQAEQEKKLQEDTATTENYEILLPASPLLQRLSPSPTKTSPSPSTIQPLPFIGEEPPIHQKDDHVEAAKEFIPIKIPIISKQHSNSIDALSSDSDSRIRTKKICNKSNIRKNLDVIRI